MSGGNAEPAEVIAFFRRHRGWITAEPVGGVFQVRIHWRPELAELSRDFERGADALEYVLRTADEHGVIAAIAFRPAEANHEHR